MSIDPTRMNEIQIIPSINAQLDTPPAAFAGMLDTRWRDFFNREQAAAVMFAHIETLPSSSTPEKHTLSVYTHGLNYYLSLFGDFLPTVDLLHMYIAHLKGRIGASTIASRYMAPLRHYLNALANQAIDLIELSDRDFRYVTQCKEQIRAALAIKPPAKETRSDRPAVEQHGHRLKWSEFQRILEEIDSSTITGKRDLALIYIGFTTGMRIAELQRMTPSSIEPGETTPAQIRVRRKRGNIDPIPVDDNVPKLVAAYIESYNAPLDEADPRRITADSPLWRPLTRSSNHFTIGQRISLKTVYEADHAMHISGIRYVINSRSQKAIGYKIQAHDMRRTIATIMRNNGYETHVIQRLLGHASATTTERYIGDQTNLSQCLITNTLSIELPI